ncbi:glycosyltransferase [Modestobacter sp. VKM Ac-2986]|uniref:glycosyltransferase n=1 Tax=Modestobacter sp. VKM Ac-2986 TaxID=3004140 RepID=UPI0022ABC576|nr:glycosyltransferase [Modestobacter sp. VKM Ac-2986]MCZ2830446.1 glycosyltransferase [Modestobacter sp. VKM Ac-2986]
MQRLAGHTHRLPDVKILMDAGPWLPVPPVGYGGLENVVATLTTELRRRGHRVVLAASGDSRQDADGHVSAFPTGQFTRLAAPYPQVVGAAHAHAQAVVAAVHQHAAAGEPFDVVHTHLEVVGPAVLAALGDAAPPVLHTLHWDLRRNADFYGSFDGGGRVHFVGVSASQVARGPVRLRRQTLGAVPLSVPIPDTAPAGPDERDASVLVLSRMCEDKGTDTAVRACRAAGVPLVLAGPVGGLPDRAALDAALADPASPVRGYPDVRWFLEHVDPLLDGEHARWIGSVDGAEKADLLRRARAVLFPLRWDEPGGTAVCEALAAGTPVVAMARGCLPDLVEDGVTGFLAETEAGFTAALSRLDELDPAACAETARRRFAPAAMAQAYERLYAQVRRRALLRVAPRHVPRARAEDQPVTR